ncbi:MULTISPECIES: glycosyltransferase family 2 protein [unclassified Ruminococcus]|uniref:glycosyltransferase family 2 protein n=1 Tax=unclassified Ruminococcus TaxID=2608920 RepID=UPI00210892BA|nr:MULTISPECIES: glycosyltransferase family 2 protein [unclassified Ruminococcus]MCQ4023185.1 glycosyltransferase [Ruminococcus sp. zg-924]MCQ4115403.1 glycosyltransferase [Ruminococcus sp. zg-921]
MIISLCIIAYNEEGALARLFEDIKAQTFPKSQTQVVLVNSRSTDSTRRLMESFAEQNTQYHSVVVVNCRKRLQAAAWNTAITHTTGDVIIRLDAHSTIPSDFLAQNASVIEGGEYVCGGARPTKAESETPWQMTLLAAEDSMFGSSFASYRRESDERRYVDTLFHAAYRTEVFANVGGFNEQLGRTEDNEMHYRIRQAGYKICCDPRIKSYQYIRSSLSKMIKQKFGNGFWVALTLGVCPKCISIFHFAPLCLLLAILVLGIIALLGFSMPLIALLCVYALFDLLITVGAFFSETKYPHFLLLPLIFPILHLSYGVGSVLGLLKMPFWRYDAKRKSKRGIERVKKKLESRKPD